MSYSKRAKTVKRLFRFIWNNLIGAWEVWDKANETLDHLEDETGKIKKATKAVKEQLSTDYQDAEKYVKEGVSDAKEIWRDLKKVF